MTCGIVIAIPITFGFLVSISIHYYEWMHLLQLDLETIDSIEGFNNCVDELSTLNKEMVPLADIMFRVKGITFLLIFGQSVLGLAILVLCFAACCEESVEDCYERD